MIRHGQLIGVRPERLADYIQRQWAAQPGRKLDEGRAQNQ